jgi:hypothetical protein
MLKVIQYEVNCESCFNDPYACPTNKEIAVRLA